MVRGQPLQRGQLAILAALALLTVAAWGLMLRQLPGTTMLGGLTGGSPSGMDHAAMTGPGGTPMGDTLGDPADAEPDRGLVVYLGLWVSMMAAMMLPAATPMILMFGTVYRARRARGDLFVPTWVFVVGYLGVWTVFGLGAWGLGEVGAGLVRANPWLAGFGPRAAAAAMLAAGAYQLTPLKERCLAQCRSPLSFVTRYWRAGLGGAFRMGAEHGAYCVGCCWMLFVLLVVVGLSSLAWMGLIALIVSSEKLLPRARAVTLSVSGLLVALGLLTLLRPDLLLPTVG